MNSLYFWSFDFRFEIEWNYKLTMIDLYFFFQIFLKSKVYKRFDIFQIHELPEYRTVYVFPSYEIRHFPSRYSFFERQTLPFENGKVCGKTNWFRFQMRKFLLKTLNRVWSRLKWTLLSYVKIMKRRIRQEGFNFNGEPRYLCYF